MHLSVGVEGTHPGEIHAETADQKAVNAAELLPDHLEGRFQILAAHREHGTVAGVRFYGAAVFRLHKHGGEQ